MTLYCKNWQLNLLAFILICFLTLLGFWQLSRAQQKKLILEAYSQRGEQTLLASDLTKIKDYRFYQVELQGHFDNKHTFLLDNKIFHGKVGYEVYTPFKAEGLSSYILVDRGFIPLGDSRQKLPIIKAINEKTTIQGLMNVPPAYFAFGKMQDSQIIKGPLRVEYINLNEMTQLTGLPFLPYVLNLKRNHAAAYEVEWQIILMPPEKHQAYALQWFALALTLLILFVVLNFKRNNKVSALQARENLG